MMLLCAAMNLLGIQIAVRYKKRMQFWQQMKKMAEWFETEIRFTSDSPEKILQRFAKRPNYTQWQSGELTEAFPIQFAKTARQIAQPLGLAASELSEIDEFGFGLGCTDLEGQLSHCNGYSRMFEDKIEAAREDYRTKGKLFRSLFTLASAAVMIMLW